MSFAMSNPISLESIFVMTVCAGLLAPGPVRAAMQDDAAYEQNRRCLECHGQPHIAELSPEERLTMVGTWLGPGEAREPIDPAVFRLHGDEPQTRPRLHVTADALAGTVHKDLRCVECHEDAARLPHAPRLNLLTCAESCHTDAYARYIQGAHNAAANGNGAVKGPGCSTCHGMHDIKPVDSRDAPTHPLKMARICAQCHERQTTPTSNGKSNAERVELYVDSIHGHLVFESGLVSAATCEACHENHRVLPANDVRSTVHRSNIPDTCGQCHMGVADTYATSIHGRLFDEGDERAPSCVDCHSAHGIAETDDTRFMLDIINECGDCHDTPEMAGGLRLTFYESYRMSYHGQVTELGSTRAARCSDCHGAHDILPLDDPDSRVSDAHLVETCQTCHPKANASFAEYDPHADYRDRDRYPVLFGIWIYFIIVMSSAFGFFGMHTILWFMRSTIERIRHGAPKHHDAPAGSAVVRFSFINRFNHALAALSFFGLTATGIPLLFAEHGWAQTLANAFGGVVAAGVWHRAFAVILIFNGFVFTAWLIYAALTRRCSFRRWFMGPTSLMPRLKDFRDCVGMFRWFLFGGRKPAFDRWTYWEKFDFWCEIGGTVIIGGSGLLLWFPTFFSTFLPGWLFNAATVVHGFEALLAIGFIFTIHFFNANLRIEKFPVDDVMFTGRVPEDELKEERPLEYERLAASNELESHRAPTVTRVERLTSVFVGLMLMAIGLALITLIILAGLEVI